MLSELWAGPASPGRREGVPAGSPHSPLSWSPSIGHSQGSPIGWPASPARKDFSQQTRGHACARLCLEQISEAVLSPCGCSQGTAALVWFEPSPSGGSGWGRTWRGHLLGLSDPSVSSGFYGLLVTRGRHWSWAGSGYSPPPAPQSGRGVREGRPRAAGGSSRGGRGPGCFAGCALGLCAVVKEAEVLEGKALGPVCRREPGSDPSPGVWGKGEAGRQERTALS